MQFQYDSYFFFPQALDALLEWSIKGKQIPDYDVKLICNQCIKRLQLFSKELNAYLKFKNKYEIDLFAENYIECERCLHKIENETGASMWLIHQKMILFYQTEQKAFCDDVAFLKQKIWNADTTCKELLSYFDQMSNMEIPYLDYLKEIEQLSEGGNVEKQYIRFKAGTELNWRSSTYLRMVIYDNASSLVDWYESFVLALQRCIYDKKIKLLIAQTAYSVYRTIKDFRIRNVCIAGGMDIRRYEVFDKDALILIHEYTAGNYNAMLAYLEKEKLLSEEVDFERCKLYLKANIDISRYLQGHKSFWSFMFDIYGSRYNQEMAIEKIGLYYKLFHGTSWGSKIYRILKRKVEGFFDESILRASVIDDKVLTTMSFNMIASKNEKLKFLGWFGDTVVNSRELLKYSLGEGNPQRTDIADFRLIYYGIQNLERNNMYEEAILKCMDFMRAVENSEWKPYYMERIKRVLYDLYIKTGKITEAVHLYVDSFVLSQAYTIRMSEKEVFDALEMNCMEDLKADIYLPVFAWIYYRDPKEVILYYLDYMQRNRYESIEDFCAQCELKSNVEEIFLDKLCGEELLIRDYYSIKRLRKNARQLRRIVLFHLLQHYSNIKYNEELRINIREENLEKKADIFGHNRIYIDTDNLLRYLVEKYHGEYIEYWNLWKLIQAGLPIREHIEKLYEKKLIFEKLVLIVQREYLTDSPYSLEHFLSTRIRHVYINECLKQELEKAHLFCKRMSDDSEYYEVNDYWKKRLSNEDFNKVIIPMSRFSSNIDKCIKQIRDEWLRVKGDNNTNGMFDYSGFCREMYERENEYSQEQFNEELVFFNTVITYLDKQTRKNALYVKERIMAKLKEEYNNQLEILEKEIKKLEIEAENKKRIEGAIEKSKARCIEDIERFCDVFNFRDEAYSNFKISDVIEFCNVSKDDFKAAISDASIEVSDSENLVFDGKIFPYVVDVIDLLLNNAVEHSGTDIKRLKIKISINEAKNESGVDIRAEDRGISKGKYTNTITVENNLARDVDRDRIKKNIRAFETHRKDIKYIMNHSLQGKGSGFYKIMRTFFFHLKQYVDLMFDLSNPNVFRISIFCDLDRYKVA